jgi:hypothetical protein
MLALITFFVLFPIMFITAAVGTYYALLISYFFPFALATVLIRKMLREI